MLSKWKLNNTASNRLASSIIFQRELFNTVNKLISRYNVVQCESYEYNSVMLWLFYNLCTKVIVNILNYVVKRNVFLNGCCISF